MIGDYVLVSGTPRKVEMITKKKIGYHINPQENRLYYARLKDVEPIEITEEMIINSGFTECKSSPYNVYIHKDEEARLFVYLHYPIKWRTVDVVKGITVDKHIIYLHQYQQILRLEQIEIDWKL